MRHHPLILALGTLLGALLGTLVVGAPAQAAACSGTSGVTVVVQFPDHTEIGCAAGNPSSGFAALRAAGFSLAYAQGNGAGALCRIDGVPGDNPCTSMPPADAYWSYWHAKPGGSWGYASTGGGAYDPAPGSVEGWRFGDGKSAPSTPPPAVSSPKPTPKPTTTPKPEPTPTKAPKPTPTKAAATVAAPDAVATTASATGSATPSASASAPATPVPSASAGDDPTADTTVAAAGAEDEAPAADSADSGGLSWVWGVLLLAVVGTAGTVTYLRRRQG